MSKTFLNQSTDHGAPIVPPASGGAVLTKPRHHSPAFRLIRLGIVLLVALVGLGWYYQNKTDFPIEPLYSNVTYTGKPLGIYYLDMPFDWRPSTQLIDAEGFAMIRVEGKLYRQPVSHCELIFDAFHHYAQTHSPQDAQKVIHLADILVNEMKKAQLGGRECTVLWYNFHWPPCMPHQVPWPSAMAQGFAMSALCRAYEVEPKPEYLRMAKACLTIFDVDLKDGGVLSHDPQGNVYYEEYAIPGKAYHVLNGFIYCLLGLYDLYRATGDTKAKSLYDTGIKTLSTPGILNRYDQGFWTTYDQSPFHYPSFNYSAIHIRQLNVLYSITGKQIFKDTEEKWRPYNLEHRYRVQFFVWSCWKRVLDKMGLLK